MNEKKEALKRAILGAPLGIAIGFIVSLVISFFIGKGEYFGARPELIVEMGSELNAIVLQTGLSALLGITFGAASVIWELEELSLAKQTGIYFLATALTMLPIAWFMHWTERSVRGIAIYFGVFLVIFVVIWGIQYLIWKQKIKKVNEKLN